MSTDIVFSFDTTGSMYPAIAELRRKVESTIRKLFATVDDLRIGLIAHGDYFDSPYETKAIELTAHEQTLVDFIRTVETTNGFGNGGECYELAINKARDMTWRADANKVYVMIGDEPAHTRRMIRSGRDGRLFTPTLSWQAESNALKSIGVIQYVVRCLDRSDSRQFHKQFAHENGTPLLHLAQFADIEKIITALTFKAQSNDLVLAYGNELETSGGLNRNVAHILNLLLDADNLIGGLDFATTTTSGDLEAVPPWRFQALNVDANTDIMSFVQSTGAAFARGRGFYQLTKSELVQERKEVVLQSDKGDLYSGDKAREMIGLPKGMRGTVTPRDIPAGYTAFIQSTSLNRKLLKGTRFLYEAT